MIIRTALLAALFAAFAASACAQPQPDQRARAIYEAQCAACHSPAPGAPVGDLTRRAPPAFNEFVRAVRSGDSPSGEMPAFTPEMISDADLRALHDYINRVRAAR